MEVPETSMEVEELEAQRLVAPSSRDTSLDAQQHRANGEVPPQGVLLGSATLVPDRNAAVLLIDLVADGGHDVDFDPLSIFCIDEVCLERVDVFIFGLLGQNRHQLHLAEAELAMPCGEVWHGLQQVAHGYVLSTAPQTNRQVEVVGVASEEEVAHVAPVDEDRHVGQASVFQERVKESQDLLVNCRDPLHVLRWQKPPVPQRFGSHIELRFHG
mmetsp:Transcript_9197/g.24127  ORF Transcript_9197/g.24127 Transcript_9197/m.24127 type:complete len:214 (-) Transcript_9197:122-763(-)